MIKLYLFRAFNYRCFKLMSLGITGEKADAGKWSFFLFKGDFFQKHSLRDFSSGCFGGASRSSSPAVIFLGFLRGPGWAVSLLGQRGTEKGLALTEPVLRAGSALGAARSVSLDLHSWFRGVWLLSPWLR